MLDSSLLDCEIGRPPGRVVVMMRGVPIKIRFTVYNTNKVILAYTKWVLFSSQVEVGAKKPRTGIKEASNH